MTASERKSILDRISAMEGTLKRIRERLSNPEKDDPEMTEYDLNRLKTAIHNFKKVQLPKITPNEKSNMSHSRNSASSQPTKPKPNPVHG